MRDGIECECGDVGLNWQAFVITSNMSSPGK